MKRRRPVIMLDLTPRPVSLQHQQAAEEFSWQAVRIMAVWLIITAAGFALICATQGTTTNEPMQQHEQTK